MADVHTEPAVVVVTDAVVRLCDMLTESEQASLAGYLLARLDTAHLRAFVNELSEEQTEDLASELAD